MWINRFLVVWYNLRDKWADCMYVVVSVSASRLASLRPESGCFLWLACRVQRGRIEPCYKFLLCSPCCRSSWCLWRHLCKIRAVCLYKYFCLLHDATVLLLMYCYTWNKFCLNQSRIAIRYRFTIRRKQQFNIISSTDVKSSSISFHQQTWTAVQYHFINWREQQ